MNGKRMTYHILCLGKEEQTTERSMLDQKDTHGRLFTNSPSIRELRSEQHSWVRALGPFIFPAQYTNTDLYNEFMDKRNEPAVLAVDEVILDDVTSSS